MFGTFDPFHRFLQRVSAEYYGWLDVRKTLGIESHYSPLRELHLFLGGGANRERALELLRLDNPLACDVWKSRRPVHDGFITTMRFTPGPTGGDMVARATAFFDEENAIDAEPFLRDCYGDPALLEKHEVFDFMDYPMFDQGTGCIGFGLMVDKVGTRWLWSRIVFAHK